MLALNSTINAINLQRNKLGQEGTLLISEALKKNRAIKLIDLSANNIKHNGAEPLVELININSTLQSIDISSNAIGSLSAKKLAEALTGNCSILRINLSNNNILEEGASALGKMLAINSVITNLNISDNKLGTVGAENLIKGLKTNSVLRELIISENQLDLDTAKLLSEYLKSSPLERINISKNPLTPQGFSLILEALKDNTSIQSIDLADIATIDNAVAQSISNLFKNNSTISSVSLRRNKMKDESIGIIAEGLILNKSISSLDLYETEFGLMDIQPFLQVLQMNSSITSLNLSGNKIGTRMPELTQMLTHNTSITDLDLSDNNCEDLGGIAIAQVLKENSTIKSINVKGNEMGPSTALEMAEMFKLNSTLTALDFTETISQKGATALLEALEFNSTIIQLRLKHNLELAAYQAILSRIGLIIRKNSINHKLIHSDVSEVSSGKLKIEKSSTLNVLTGTLGFGQIHLSFQNDLLIITPRNSSSISLIENIPFDEISVDLIKKLKFSQEPLTAQSPSILIVKHSSLCSKLLLTRSEDHSYLAHWVSYQKNKTQTWETN
uniref:PH domain-containing protein n=1 Tax=Arcella intermedia TaxID=1963864 RepID=A0A6B2L0N1_9EUKA